VLTASGDGVVRVWDAGNGRALTEPFRHGIDINAAQFSPDGHGVVVGGSAQTAYVWDVRSVQAVVGPLRHESDVTLAQFSPDGLRILTASLDGAVRVWSATDGKLIAQR